MHDLVGGDGSCEHGVSSLGRQLWDTCSAVVTRRSGSFRGVGVLWRVGCVEGPGRGEARHGDMRA